MGDFHGVGSPSTRGLKVQMAATSVLLSLLFLVIYGGTNWLTAQRSAVGTWYFPWELGIPFVPLMIVPYMSIDLFFIAAPFLCRDALEVRVFAWRVVFAILVAGAVFLLFPLQLAYERVPVEGPLGLVFETFRGMDQPYNLFPSLHITLRTLLAAVYARATAGLVRLATMVWFSLIGFSTVLTHQHHLVDVAGGFVLAGFAFYLFRESRHRLPVLPNRRVGCWYGAAGVSLLGVAMLVWPWGAFLLWPMAALGIVAAAYWGMGPGIYRKTEGRLPLSTRFVLAPILLGQVASLLYYRRQCRPWDAICPGVLIGRQLTRTEALEAVDRGVTAVLDLTAEFSEAALLLALRYRNLAILDLTSPTPAQLCEAVAYLAEEAARGTVYVHCKIGYSRSAAVVGAYLMASGQARDDHDAIALMRLARPSLIVREEVVQALRQFARRQEQELAAAP